MYARAGVFLFGRRGRKEEVGVKDWVLIGIGLLCVGGLALAANGCGKRAPTVTTVTLSPADRQAVEAAAKSIAAAAAQGDSAALDAALNAKLPRHELSALRAALALLKGRPALQVTGAEGLSTGAAAVTLAAASGPARTWRFDRIDGAWKLSAF
jgi:hypothetical protein